MDLFILLNAHLHFTMRHQEFTGKQVSSYVYATVSLPDWAAFVNRR